MSVQQNPLNFKQDDSPYYDQIKPNLQNLSNYLAPTTKLPTIKHTQKNLKQEPKDYNYIDFYTHTLLPVQLFIINDPTIQTQQVKQIYSKYLQKKKDQLKDKQGPNSQSDSDLPDPNFQIPFTRTFQQAKQQFFQAGRCYFRVFADIENTKKIIKDKTVLSQISQINVYNDLTSQGYKSFNKLKKLLLPNKIHKFYHDFKQYAKDFEPYIDYHQQFVKDSKGKIIPSTNREALNSLLPAYFILDQDFSASINYKLNLLASIKILENQTAYTKKRQRDNSVEAVSEVENKSLNFQNFVSNLESNPIKNNKFQIQKSPLQFYKSIQRKFGYLQENIVKILCLYKADCFYHKIFNSILRLAKRASDFDIISIPFAETYHSIKNLYHQKLEKNKWKRDEQVVWRVVRLQDLQNLKRNKGKTCEFYGVVSTSKKYQQAIKFGENRTQEDYCLVKIVIPQFQYKEKDDKGKDDPRLKNDHGFFEYKEIVSRVEYFECMKELHPNEKNLERFRKDQEEEILINALNSFKFVGEGKLKINQEQKEYFEFVYQTQHQIQQQEEELKKQLVKEKRDNFISSKNEQSLQKIKEIERQLQEIDRILTNLKYFNQQFNQVHNMGDLYKLLGDPDKALQYYKSQQQLSSKDLLKFIQSSQQCGEIDEPYYAIKKLLDNQNFKFLLNPNPQQKKIEEKVKQTIQNNQDFLQLTLLQQKKLSLILQSKQSKWIDKAKIYYEISLSLIADNMWQQAHSYLQKGKDILESKIIVNNQKAILILSEINQSSSSCSSCFLDILRSLLNKNNFPQQMIDQHEDLLRYLELLIQTNYYFINCQLNLSKIKLSQQVEDQINQKMYKIDKNPIKVQSQSQQNLSKLIHLYQELNTDKNSSSYADILQASLKKSQISQNLTAANSGYVTSKINETEIEIPQSVSSQSKNKNFFDSKRCDSIIESAKQDFKQSLRIKVYNQGDNNLDVLKTRRDFASFLFDVDQQTESIEQSFIIIRSHYGDKHSVASQAYYLLSKVYQSRGQHKRAFKVLALAIQILKKAKIKEDRNQEKRKIYQQIYELSQIRIRIELMKVKIYRMQSQMGLKSKALKSLNAIQSVLLTNKSSISTSFLAQISQQKGDCHGLENNNQQSQKNCVQEFKKAITRISNQKGYQNISVGNCLMSLAKYTQSYDAQKSQEYFKQGFQIYSAFPVNHPCMWNAFLMKAKINETMLQKNNSQKTIDPNKDVFDIQLYALRLAEERYKSPLHINNLKMKIQTYYGRRQPLKWKKQSFYDILKSLKMEIEQSLKQPLQQVQFETEDLDQQTISEIDKIENENQQALQNLRLCIQKMQLQEKEAQKEHSNNQQQIRVIKQRRLKLVPISTASILQLKPQTLNI